MTAEEKRVATVINTASGRNALRGLGNEFGSLELQQADERKLYKQHKEVMKGIQRKRNSKEEVSVPSTSKQQKMSKVNEGKAINGDHTLVIMDEITLEKSKLENEKKQVSDMKYSSEGKSVLPLPEKLSSEENQMKTTVGKMETGKKMLDKSNVLKAKVGEYNQEGYVKVFAKIRGFPYWPAEMLAVDDNMKGKVRFQDGQIGVGADLADFTTENFKKLSKTLSLRRVARVAGQCF